MISDYLHSKALHRWMYSNQRTERSGDFVNENFRQWNRLPCNIHWIFGNILSRNCIIILWMRLFPGARSFFFFLFFCNVSVSSTRIFHSSLSASRSSLSNRNYFWIKREKQTTHRSTSSLLLFQKKKTFIFIQYGSDTKTLHLQSVCLYTLTEPNDRMGRNRWNKPKTKVNANHPENFKWNFCCGFVFRASSNVPCVPFEKNKRNQIEWQPTVTGKNGALRSNIAQITCGHCFSGSHTISINREVKLLLNWSSCTRVAGDAICDAVKPDGAQHFG